MDWYERLERFVVERRTFSAVLTLAIVGAAVWIPRGFTAYFRGLEEEQVQYLVARQTIASHKEWLSARLVDEKRLWPFSVCRPGARPDGKCDCGAFETRFYDMVAFTEVLPNGDVACHLTK